MRTSTPRRAVIVGLGSIGRRHLATLRRLRPEIEIGIWRHSRASADAEAANEHPVLFTAEEVASFAPQIAVVANPAPFHLWAASALAALGVHLLIEKPLSHTVSGIDELIARCRARDLVLMTGYTLRFSRPLQLLHEALTSGRIGRLMYVRAEVGSYLPDWRPGSDYRQVVSARQELGGGAVLELSHELDYVRWLCGEITSVNAHVSRLSGLEIEVEDTAEIMMRFESGVLGSVHLDMVQRVPVRRCRLVGTDGTLESDGITGGVYLQRPAEEGTEIHPPGVTRPDAMYEAQLTHFLECVAEGKTPLVTAEDGRRAVQVVEAVKQSSIARQWVDLT